MGLRKGATFHTPPSSPLSSTSDAFVPPTLSRAQSNLDDVVDAHVRRAALVIGSVDKTLSLEGLPSNRPTRAAWRDESIPVPRGFLAQPPTVDPAMAAKEHQPAPERRSMRLRQRRSSNNHESDSGLGTSLASTVEKHAASSATVGPSSKKASAITRSAATVQNLPGLTQKAINRISEHILRPLLAKSELRDFRPILVDVPSRIAEKEIVCLRDLEKTLIFMAPVSSQTPDDLAWARAYKTMMKERAKTADLYLDFCLSSIRCIQATVEYLPERDQTRTTDRPYTNGYFIDLVEQIRQYADQLRAAKDAESDEVDIMDLDRYVSPADVFGPPPADILPSTDEVKLIGGIAENGQPAQLVRIRKDGKAISMATGLPVDIDEDVKGPIQLKRSLSQQAEDEEEIMRSMARRKKNATPEELAPKRCNHPGCDKEFKRPCDLTKHEKTHSRPWKCPFTTCKYHDYGWPTEKEMDRHINDKHSSAPPMYECQFQPCPYKSKRESNCKQHMEKAHGWTYVRTKTNGKTTTKKSVSDPSSAQPTPQLGNMPTPSSNASIATPPGETVSHFMPFNGAGRMSSSSNAVLDFPAYPTNEEFAENFLATGNMLMEDINLDLPLLDQSTPSNSSSYGPYSTYQDGVDFTINDDIYGAHAQIPAHIAQQAWQDNKLMAQLQQNYMAQMPAQLPMQMPQQPMHISPIGEGNAMLFTPNSMAEVDEGFEDLPANGVGGDFQLFSNTGLSKDHQFDSLFGEVPSTGLGFSQNPSQDLFAADGMDWNMDFSTYQQ
jgi:hypothetical protein